MSPRVLIFLLFVLVSFAQEPAQPAQPQPRPVGIKITRPGVVAIAGTPPVGGTLISYGYSLDEPVAGAHLQGVSTLFEYTLAPRWAVYLITTEPLIRNGKIAIGDNCPGVKFRIATEARWRPLLAVSYGLKVPSASDGFGTGRYDHKLTWHADKGIGRTRWTGTFATLWSQQKDGSYVRQYTPAIGALTRWHGRWGSAVQAYWTTAGKGYGGIVAAPFFQVKNSFNVFGGCVRNVGRYTTAYSVVAGFNYMHRPRS
ncbi:MAG: hypothetical protein ABI759_14550 [Candidatus Solibacter sp.]